MTECEQYYFQTNTEIEIILADAAFLLDKTQRWKSKDLILSWDSDHLYSTKFKTPVLILA